MRVPKRLRRAAKYLWREWIKPLGLMAIILFPLRSAVAGWNWVPSGSMKPTILEGDLVFVNKLAYDLRVRFPTSEIAVCSALTASSSRHNHFLALDQMERILGIQVLPAVGDFIDFLGGQLDSAPLIGFSDKHPEVTLDPSTR